MFERFTDQARRIIVIAQSEARVLKHGYIGTEHLLLALIGETDLIDGTNIKSAREMLKEIAGEGTKELGGHIPFTPRAKKVLELSLREALMLNHNYIAPEHLVLGLIREGDEGDGLAIRMLSNQGIDLEALKDRMVKQLPIPSQKLETNDPHRETDCPICPETIPYRGVERRTIGRLVMLHLSEPVCGCGCHA